MTITVAFRGKQHAISLPSNPSMTDLVKALQQQLHVSPETIKLTRPGKPGAFLKPAEMPDQRLHEAGQLSDSLLPCYPERCGSHIATKMLVRWITPPHHPLHSLTAPHTGIADGHPLNSLPAQVNRARSAMGKRPQRLLAVCRYSTHSQAQPLCQPGL